MKFNYFGYSVWDERTDQQYLCDLRELFTAFASHTNSVFKNQFSYNGERVYLISLSADLYLFVQTKAEELIKKIDSQSISVSDLTQVLSGTESIGFASYVYIKRHHIAFGYKLLSPRTTCFTSFVNNLLMRLGVDDIKFKLTALKGSSTKQQALSFAYYGPTFIQVANNHTLVDRIREAVGATLDDFSDLDSIEILFKPRPRKDMTRVARSVVRNLDLDGVDKFTVRAKAHASDHMIDLHLEGEGQLFDRVNETEESTLGQALENCMGVNTELLEKVRVHETDPALSTNIPHSLSGWNTRSYWSSKLNAIHIP